MLTVNIIFNCSSINIDINLDECRLKEKKNRYDLIVVFDSNYDTFGLWIKWTKI